MPLVLDFIDRFKDFAFKECELDRGQKLLLAVSGGLDSAVLCHLCDTAGFTFAIAHCNFGLRGMESDRDENFARALAERYQVPFFVRHFETALFAQNQKLSTQEAARKLRYDWFAELIKTPLAVSSDIDTNENQNNQKAEKGTDIHASSPVHYTRLLTAHHLDDNIETSVMNFFKGTGISGLRGMLPRYGHVVRPLLFAKRSELVAYALEHGLQWVEDSSNAEVKYTRNFFRHEVLPQVVKKYPQALENIADNLRRFAEAEMLYLQAVEQHKKKLLEYRGAEVYIPVLKLAKAEPLHTLVYEITKKYGFTSGQTADVVHLLQSDTGKYVRSASHQVLRHRRWLVIAPLNSPSQNLILIEEGEGQVSFGNETLKLKEEPLPTKLATPAEVALLDARLLKFPLVLRPWKTGDYFYPLGLGKKKKISRFLIDLKLSKTDKEKVWVLESGKKIAWVVGFRIDDRFKVTPSTQSIFRLTSSLLMPNTSARRG